MPNEVGGLLDGLFKVGFDYKAFLANPDFRLGLEKIAGALKTAVSSPLNLDDKIIDGMIASLEAMLDQLKNKGPLVVGAMADTPVTAVEAISYVKGLSAKEGVTFSQEVMEKVEANPELIKLLKRKSDHYQVKLLNSPWLDTLIGWLKDYGPMVAQFLMILLPLFL